MLRRALRVASASLAVVGLLVLCGTSYFYYALGRVAPFYAEAQRADRARLQAESRELESRLSALYSEARQPGQWHTTITADEMNGWLAVQLPKTFPALLPRSVKDPRVEVTTEGVTLAFQANVKGVPTVIAVVLDVFAAENDLLAIQLRRARAGALPLPTKEVIERVQRSTQKVQLPVRWSQSSGEAVLLLDIDPILSASGQHRQLDTVELRDGEIYLAGTTMPILASKKPATPQHH